MAQIIPFPGSRRPGPSALNTATTELHKLCDQYAEILGGLQAKISVHSGRRQVGIRIDGEFPEAPVIVRAGSPDAALRKVHAVLEALARERTNS